MGSIDFFKSIGMSYNKGVLGADLSFGILNCMFFMFASKFQ